MNGRPGGRPYKAADGAFIHSTARVGRGGRIGHGAWIGPRARLGPGCVVGAYVVIHEGTRLGAGCVVGDHAVLGKTVQLAATSTVKPLRRLPGLVLGADCHVGAGAVVCAGTEIGASCLLGDQTFLRERVRVSHHVVIGRGSSVESEVNIGAWTKIQSDVYLCAYSRVADHVFLAPCVVTTNDNFMGRTKARFKFRKGCDIRRGARVGGNVTLLPGVVLGVDSFVAAGSIVTRDVPARMLVMGSPARPVRPVPRRELLNPSEWRG